MARETDFNNDRRETERKKLRVVVKRRKGRRRDAVQISDRTAPPAAEGKVLR